MTSASLREGTKAAVQKQTTVSSRDARVPWGGPCPWGGGLSPRPMTLLCHTALHCPPLSPARTWPPSPAGGAYARAGVGGLGPRPSEAMRPPRGRFRRRRPPSRSRRQVLHIARGPGRTTAQDLRAGHTGRSDLAAHSGHTQLLTGRRRPQHPWAPPCCARHSRRAVAALPRTPQPISITNASAPPPHRTSGRRLQVPESLGACHVLSPPANGRKRSGQPAPAPRRAQANRKGCVCERRRGGGSLRTRRPRSQVPGSRWRPERSVRRRRAGGPLPPPARAGLPPAALLGSRAAAAAVPPPPPTLAPGDPAMPVRTECPPPAGASAASAASLIPPPPINTQQPGVATSLLYSGSKFRGHQKSKGNSYDVEVVLQVSAGAGPLAAPTGRASPPPPRARGRRQAFGRPPPPRPARSPTGPKPAIGRLRPGPSSLWPVAPGPALPPAPLRPCRALQWLPLIRDPPRPEACLLATLSSSPREASGPGARPPLLGFPPCQGLARRPPPSSPAPPTPPPPAHPGSCPTPQAGPSESVGSWPGSLFLARPPAQASQSPFPGSLATSSPLPVSLACLPRPPRPVSVFSSFLVPADLLSVFLAFIYTARTSSRSLIPKYWETLLTQRYVSYAVSFPVLTWIPGSSQLEAKRKF